MIELQEKKERLLLVAAAEGEAEDVDASLDELEELVKTAVGEAVGRLMQRRERPSPISYLGKGKVDELKELVWETEADGVVADDELTSDQIKNLEDALDVRVLDRTGVILDIFAQHATTHEGKIQVELAQLKYRSGRLLGLRSSLSRLGGGVGISNRGPGEKKLEIDRRKIRERIGQLKELLAQSEKHRTLLRGHREKSAIPTVAIVGYTNAGKSTLLNALTGAGVAAQDKLFATLDPTTRKLELPGGQQVLVTDTVGFIRKLPHHLVEAFHSTLEEAVDGDIILHVVDASNPRMESQMHTVYETLRSLGLKDKPIVTAFNKIDVPEALPALRDFGADYEVCISAKRGDGLDKLGEVLETIVRNRRVYVERVFPYAQAGRIQLIRAQGQLVSEEYLPDGIAVKAYVPAEIYGKVAGA
ncbi:MAG: GTPase HflX [Lachnospiraceae bacterium]|jgi:GTP-binding protein HflX|nr:GTPase HflX [Lachnospiraceae bacterium]